MLQGNLKLRVGIFVTPNKKIFRQIALKNSSSIPMALNSAALFILFQARALCNLSTNKFFPLSHFILMHF